MASKSYESSYKKHYGQRLANISHDTTEEQIKQVYQDWANQYEKVGANIALFHLSYSEKYGGE